MKLEAWDARERRTGSVETIARSKKPRKTSQPPLGSQFVDDERKTSAPSI
jgi:hypothetical protein